MVTVIRAPSLTTVRRLHALNRLENELLLSTLVPATMNDVIKEEWERQEGADMGLVMSPCNELYCLYKWWTYDVWSAYLRTFLRVDTDDLIAENLVYNGVLRHRNCERGDMTDTMISCDAKSMVQPFDSGIAYPDLVDDSASLPDLESCASSSCASSECATDSACSVSNAVQIKEPTKENEFAHLNGDSVEVKMHRRVHKVDRERYARCVVDEVRLKFGVPSKTSANLLAIRRFAASIMQKHGVRPSHQVKMLPFVVAAAFVPTMQDVESARWLECAEASERRALCAPLTGMLGA